MGQPIRITRRRFIQSSAAFSTAAFLPAASWARVLGGNERITFDLGAASGSGPGLRHPHVVRNAQQRRGAPHLACALQQGAPLLAIQATKWLVQND